MSSAVPVVQLGPTYGAVLLASFVSVALWGTTCMQTVIYFIQYPKDRLSLKALVMWLWLADTVHQIFIVKGVYDSQIIGFCNFSLIQIVVPEFLWQGLFTTLVSISSQAFFTYRLWKFSGKRWFCWALLVPVCLFEFAAAVAFIVFGMLIPTTAELVSAVPSSIFTAGQAVAAAADLTITAGLVLLLIQNREHALLKRSRTVLQKLLVLTINTGVWTALFAVFALIAILAFKQTLVYVALYFSLCPLYCNTVLANLNARDFLKTRSMAVEGGMINSPYPLRRAFVSPPVTSPLADPTLPVQAEVNKSVICDADEPALRALGSKFDLE